MGSRLTFLLPLLFLNSFIYSQNNKADIIFFHIYNQQYELAETEISQHSKKLNNFTKTWLSCDLQWWRTISVKSKESYNQLEKYLKNGIKKEMSRKHPSQFIIGLYKNYLLRLTASQKKHFATLKYFYQVESYNKIIDKTNLNTFEKNIYDIYKAVFALSKSSLWVYSNKNDNQAIATLKKLADSSSLMIKTLASYFLVKIYLEIKKTPKNADTYIDRLINMYPNNKTFKALSNKVYE